ncbi:transcriptional regulator [Enterococcus faecalis]
MNRKLYDFYGKEMNFNKGEYYRVYYVQCDCGHLAIRKNKTTKAVFRCSLCKKEYRLKKTSRIVEQIFLGKK